MREYKLHSLWIQVWIVFFYGLKHKSIHNLISAITRYYYLPEEHCRKDFGGGWNIKSYKPFRHKVETYTYSLASALLRACSWNTEFPVIQARAEDWLTVSKQLRKLLVFRNFSRSRQRLAFFPPSDILHKDPPKVYGRDTKLLPNSQRCIGIQLCTGS